VSYGEYVRVDDQVVVTMPLGADVANPTLQLVTLEASSVDWPRTEEYAQSARYQRYAVTRAEDDFAVMSAEVAAILNEIAFSTDRQRAVEIAEEARRRLAAWPAEHMGYRAADVADILGLVDDALSRIGGRTDGSGIQLSLVAVPTVKLEPMLGLPNPRDQIRRLVTLADGNVQPADRMALWRAAIALIDDPRSGVPREESADLRRTLEGRIRDEIAVDDAYARLTQRLLAEAHEQASRARVTAVERVIDGLGQEDARLGQKRPATMRGLRAALDAKLEAARDLRLRRDQWTTRRRVYREYVTLREHTVIASR
jgi:hypothetical protein